MNLTRRSFCRVAGATAAAHPFLRFRPGRSPVETLHVACVGVGGMGASDLDQTARGTNVEIVALCDVDANNLNAAKSKHEKARTFADFRVMFDAMSRDIDAVVVSTPDHMHGPVSIAALELGKHVYCQKPLAHNLHECRRMTALATSKGLVTQMGTQIHAHAAYRTAVAMLQRGTIGKVREAHLWVGKSWSREDGRPETADDPPAHLDWDLWLGVAPYRDYVAGIYHPMQWRGWKDFGTGTLGDMGCHIFDPVFTALELGAPETVVSRGPQHFEETFAPDSDIVYTFGATPWTDGKITLRWTDGAARPDRSKAQLPDGVELPGSGSFLVGERGVMVIPHWAMPTFYQDGERLDVELDDQGHVNHYHEWTDACRGEGRTTTAFDYSGPLTEAVLTGTIAGRLEGEVLAWDSEALAFDSGDANAFVERSYRDGWSF